MPWTVQKDSRCPATKPFGVVKKTDGTLEGCHPTKEAGLKQAAALYANEAKMSDIEATDRAEWSTAYINDLPDSAFACIDKNGRHYPHHDKSGKVDDAHLANARARVKQAGTTSCGYDHLFHTHHLPSDQENAMPEQGISRLRPPRDNIVRAVFPGTELRDAGEDRVPTLYGHFARFNEWTRIESVYEGTFMERVAPGSFSKTFAEPSSRARVKITLNHGQDPDLGDKPIAVPKTLEEDGEGAFYEAPLLDGVPPLVVSGLRAGAYGSSFRFRVTRDDFERNTKASDYNPDGLPERTIREVELFEFGPVTYPAYAGSTASVRSMTDDFIRHLIPPEAPSVTDAGALPHLESERRDPPADPPPPVAASKTKDPPEGGSSDSRSNPVPEEYTTIEDKRARWVELNDSIERMAEHPGVLPEDVQVTWNAETAERDKLGRDLAAYDSHQAAVIRNAADGKTEPGEDRGVPKDYKGIRIQPPVPSEAELHSPESRSTTPEGRVAEFRDHAKRILEKTKFAYGLADQTRSADKVAYMLDHADSPDGELARRVKYTSAPAYERAFHKFITSRGETWGFTPEEQRGTALAVGVDATGGFTVPFAFDPTIIAIGVHGGAVNPYRATCRVVQIVGTDTWRAVTATAVVATRTTEAAVTTEQGPTFALPEYIVKRVQGQITASFEMFQDRADLGSEMASLIQEAKDNEEEASWAIGNGSGTASIGVGTTTGVSGSYTALNTASALVIVEGDLTATEAALPVRHRFGAQWFFNRVNIRKAQSLETTGGKLFGGSIYFPSVGQVDLSRDGNTGLRLLGYPVNESPSLPTSTATTITIGTLLNPNQYVIVDRIGMSVQFIPFIFGAAQGNLVTGQQALYFLYRNHAAPLNVDAGRTLRFT